MSSQKPRITFSSYDSLDNPYYGGGGAMATHNIAKRLSYKYDLRIVCSTYPGAKNRMVDGVNYEYIGLSTKYHKLAQILFVIFLILEVGKQHKYDLWFENFTPPYSTNFLPIFTRKPVVGVASLLHAKQFSQKYGLPFYLIENIGLKTYKHIILLNSEFSKKLIDINKKVKVYIIPRGIEKSYLEERPLKSNIILFLGRIDIFQKGIDILIDSWLEVSKKFPRVKLFIAGSGPKSEIDQVVKLVEEKKLSNQMKLIGKVNGEKKFRILRECLFGVVPSRFESFGNSALEFLAFSKPIVTFDIDGMRWMPDTVSIKAKSFDERELARAITQLLSDKKKREEMGKKARKFAGNFEWSKIIDQYDSLIQNLL